MNTYRINNLPCGALTHIAGFLTVPSRALFAVAISTARNEFTNEDRLSIVGSQSDILDFGEIKGDLAAKLTDDHVRDVLFSVDAVNRLKRLMLTGCTNVTGAGLEPLRGSLVIEQIDLGSMETSTRSLNCVLPILDSIIVQERCVLKHLAFPRVWRSRGERPYCVVQLQQFILRYNEIWARRQDELNCFKCSASLPQQRNGGRFGFGPWVQDMGGPWIQSQSEGNHFDFGIDRHTCYGCLKHYCRNCENESGSKTLANCGCSDTAVPLMNKYVMTVVASAVNLISTLAIPAASSVMIALKATKQP
ncbi:hypothetical protein ACHAWC_011121 [Mediolabrus comicus]